MVAVDPSGLTLSGLPAVAGRTQATPVHRVVGVLPERHQCPPVKRMVIGVRGRTFVADHADGVPCQHASAEALAVLPAVPALCRRRPVGVDLSAEDGQARGTPAPCGWLPTAGCGARLRWTVGHHVRRSSGTRTVHLVWTVETARARGAPERQDARHSAESVLPVVQPCPEHRHRSMWTDGRPDPRRVPDGGA